MEKGTMNFRVDTMGLLTEIADSGLSRRMGILKIPLNIFKNLLGEVAQRAIELNDPKMNICMLNLALYEVPPHEIPNAIEHQKELIRKEIMDFSEALRILDIEDYADRIFNSNSKGESYYLKDYFILAETLKDDATAFRPWFINVVKAAEEQWERPESVFQHIRMIYFGSTFMKSIRHEKSNIT